MLIINLQNLHLRGISYGHININFRWQGVSKAGNTIQTKKKM